MKRTAILIGVLCFFVVTFAQVAPSQKVPNAAGNWDAITRTPDHHDFTEQWTIQQNGNKITAKVKTAHGELSVTGEIDEVGFFRVDYKDGDMTVKVRATLDNDALDGSVTIGKDEHLWTAKRKSK